MGDLLSEHASSAKPPLLKSGIYSFWENMMKAYIISINDKALMSVSDVEEKEEFSDDREYTSNYIAHPTIYKGKFEDSSEDSSSNKESEYSSNSEDSEVSSDRTPNVHI
ncbi:hypothetical protein Dsin_028887 [Dipteronia sinensis]|uniref:Uncharacterized protein n=1 Tax=Dipteronia sinensis TaxID=43782 RepID=A0AAE0DUZ4_9ROSI|nr:hypothetical protein Dsin_028887 [Dipteronia sinensis]